MTTPRDQSKKEPASAMTSHGHTRRRQAVHSRRVFISSTSVDLHAHRKRVHDDLERMYQIPVDMAQFGAGAADATTVSYTELATAEIVVLIVAWRYGFVPTSETRSVTELEYEEAQRLKLPIYVYLADPETGTANGSKALFPAKKRDNEHAAQLAAFRARLSDSNATTYDTFDSPADLSAKVLAALGRRLLRTEQVGRHALTLARELDRRTFKLGDDNAATFEYLTEPLMKAWERATGALADASMGVGGKSGIVVLGEANAGKTRLALEAVMETLPEWPVLRWSEAFTSADLPPAGAVAGAGFVLFLDDIQNYAPFAQRGPQGQMAALVSNPAATLRALLESIATRPLVILATCRSEEEQRTHAELDWLFTKLTPVRLPQFTAASEDPEARGVIATFAANGAPHTQDWDGTLGSLVLGLSAKRQQYEALAILRSPAVDVLRAMKLLTLAGIFVHSERRLRATCTDVFYQTSLAQDQRAWEYAKDELLRLQFVRVVLVDDAEDREEIRLVIRSDTYFSSEKVIVDYPNLNDPSQLMRHLVTLERMFVALRDAHGLSTLGGVFIDHAEYRKALAAYEEALTLQPDDPSVWVNKGVTLGRLGKYTEALAAYDHALTLTPDDAGTWYNRGVALDKLGRHEEELAAYERALERRPEHAATWYNKGITLGQLGRHGEALDAYDHALALRSDHADTWFCKGFTLSALGKHEEALVAYDRSLALRSDDAGVWNNRAYARLGLKQYNEALSDIDRALSLAPHDANLWDSRGEILLAAQRYDDALGAIDAALRLEPENADWWDSRGCILLTAGRHDEALAAYGEALARTPGLASSREGKARALQALGRDAEENALDTNDGDA